MTKADLIVLARQTAEAHNLYPQLVCAICEQESDWNPWALRFEPAFFSRYVAPLFTNNKIDASEAYARGISWGLMQVMGQVARERGFEQPFLSALCDPPTGLAIGCSVFAHKLAAAEGNVERALLLWNGGANQAYPNEVLARATKYK